MHLLDTNIVSYVLRGEGGVGARMLALKRDQVAVPAVVVYELRYGLARLDGTRPIDTLIAATALATRAVLVTHNTREFGRVRGLEVEDWFDPTVPRVRMFLQEPDPPTYKAPRVATPRKRSATAAARR